MKTLNEIEPRYLISSLPYVITNSGSYYVTGNLLGSTNLSGITIQSSQVQVDMNGFTLIGSTNTGAGINETLTGIYIDDAEIYKHITIRNGVVHNWGRNGIRSILAKDCKVVGVTVSSNGGTNTYDGMKLGDSWLVTDCMAADNGGNGISTGSRCIIRGAMLRNNKLSGLVVLTDSRVVDCNAIWNEMDGIRTGSDSVVRDCVANSNTSNGINVADGCVVVGNHCAGNGNAGIGAGIFAGSDCRIEANHVRQNQFGIQIPSGKTKSLVIRNSAVMNTIAAYQMTTETHYGAILTNEVMRASFTNANPWANFSL